MTKVVPPEGFEPSASRSEIAYQALSARVGGFRLFAGVSTDTPRTLIPPFRPVSARSAHDGSTNGVQSLAQSTTQSRVIPVHPSGASKPWHTGELVLLMEHRHEGAVAVAALLGRSVPCVKAAAHRLRLSLRQPGSYRGSVLGQVRGVSLSAQVRDDLVSGAVDAEVLAERMRLDRERALCPVCGVRPQRRERSGWCLVCWRRALAEKHLELLEEIDAKRAMDAGKQALHRARERYAPAD